MRHLISVSILALGLALSASVYADEGYFRLNVNAPIFFGASAPDIGGNNPISFLVDGDASSASVAGRDFGNLNIPVTVNGIDNTYTVDVSGLPSGATWNGSAILWSPAATGTYHPVIEVRDGSGALVASQELELVIHLPLTASVPQTNYEASIGSDLTITPTAANVIGALQWGSTPDLPEWLALDAATGAIDVDTDEANELNEIVLTAVDQADMMSANTLPFSITVSGADNGYWLATLGRTATDYGQSIVSGSDGSIYVTGYTNSTGAGGYDLLVAKYAADGSLTWKKTLGGTANEYGHDINAGSDGSLYVTGYTTSGGAGGNDLLIAKYATDGSLTWKKTLGGTPTDIGYGIIAGSDGSVYVTGYTTSTGAGGADLLIAKYAADGSLVWNKTLGGTASDYGYDITAGSDGDIYVTGQTQSAGEGSNDLLIAKYATDGSLTWKKTLGGAASDYGHDITAGSDGSVYVTGYTTSTGAGGYDILVAKYGADGSLSWKKTLGGTVSEYGHDITAGSNGSVYVTGYTTSAGAGGADLFIAKYAADGSLTWKKTLGGTPTDIGYGITAGSDGSIYVTGYTNSTGAGGYDLLVARLPADGGEDMVAGAFTWQDAELTIGPDPGLTESSPAWTSPDANLTPNNASALVPGNPAALTSTTIEFEQQPQH